MPFQIIRNYITKVKADAIVRTLSLAVAQTVQSMQLQEKTSSWLNKRYKTGMCCAYAGVRSRSKMHYPNKADLFYKTLIS